MKIRATAACFLGITHQIRFRTQIACTCAIRITRQTQGLSVSLTLGLSVSLTLGLSVSLTRWLHRSLALELTWKPSL